MFFLMHPGTRAVPAQHARVLQLRFPLPQAAVSQRRGEADRQPKECSERLDPARGQTRELHGCQVLIPNGFFNLLRCYFFCFLREFGEEEREHGGDDDDDGLIHVHTSWRSPFFSHHLDLFF